MKKHTAHEFALFIPLLSTHVQPSHVHGVYHLYDAESIKRITAVLRLKPHETCTLFDRTVHVSATIHEITKKSINFYLNAITLNTFLKPDLICWLPILKKDDLEQAISMITACGITTIQLIHTAKVQRSWGGERELERLERMMIAAAEQAKYYAMPTVQAPITLEQALRTPSNAGSSMRLFFDPAGKPLAHVLPTISSQVAAVYLLLGPEGDLTLEEKEMIRAYGFTFCALTPTILRSYLAATVAAGTLRAYTHTNEFK